jgi:hypothetical protein
MQMPNELQCSFELENKRKIFGSEKQEIITNGICLLFYLFFILWISIYRKCFETIIEKGHSSL